MGIERALFLFGSFERLSGIDSRARPRRCAKALATSIRRDIPSASGILASSIAFDQTEKLDSC
jgi:hypothetical protein